jgi:hypothetical protein
MRGMIVEMAVSTALSVPIFRQFLTPPLREETRRDAGN